MEFQIKDSDVYVKYWINSAPEPITNFLTLGPKMKFPIPVMIFTYLPEGREILGLIDAGEAGLVSSGRKSEIVSAHLGAFGMRLQ